MGEKMTLERVRDWHRAREASFANSTSTLFSKEDGRAKRKHRAMADVIDAHLTQQAQAVDVGAVREVADELGRDGGRLHDEWMYKLNRAIGNAQAEGWKSIETAPENTDQVLVYTPDNGDGARIDFDYREDGIWVMHSELREHFLMVGGAAAAGPDLTCTGPSEDAPYTLWMPISDPPKPEE